MADKESPKVLGYSVQPESALRLVNENKVIEEKLLRHIEAIERDLVFDISDDSEPHRWLYIAKLHIEQGFMALNRAVFKPKRLEHVD